MDNKDEHSIFAAVIASLRMPPQRKHPIKYTITNIRKAAVPIVGYAAFVIYSHYLFHLCGSSSAYIAFCIYGILAM